MSRIRKMIGIILAAAMILSLGACDFKPAIVLGMPDPNETLDAFFTDVCKGDFEKADKYLEGLSLQIKGRFSGPFSERLYDYLLKSYSYRQIDKLDSRLTDVRCKVEFTCLDNALLAEDLKAMTTSLGKSYIASANKEYLEKEEGVLALSDEGAEKTAVEALDELMKNPDQYYSTNTYDVSMRFMDGKWIITLSDELYEAMSGRFNSK